MSCLLNSGYSLGCKDNTGGIRRFYVANYTGDTTYTYDADEVITGITSANAYYTIEQRQENGDFSQEGQHSIENGTNFWSQSATMIFHKNQSSVRNLLLVMAKTSLTVIVEDQNGKYWLMGKNNGAEISASSSGFGKAYGDLNGVTITLEAKEPATANEISAAAFGTLTVN